MNIVRKEENSTYFKNLYLGDVFERDRRTFIKIEVDQQGYNAISIVEGSAGLRSIIPLMDIVVPKPDAELHVDGIKEKPGKV